MRLPAFVRYARDGRLSWKDFSTLLAEPAPVGELPGDPLARLGIGEDQFSAQGPIEFVGIARYLNDARSVVTHTVDDSNEQLPACLDALDGYGIKATAFVTTGYRSLMPRLWPRLRQAIANGHEIGSHSRRHPCAAHDTRFRCFAALTWDEIDGSRRDILENTGQPYVWSWAYPCGSCADCPFIQRKIARAGYLMARAYPDEFHDGHVAPDLQTYDTNPYAARYTQVVQNGYSKALANQSEVAVSGRTDVPLLNAKFDEVCAAGGIYTFITHPQMIDYGRDNFYERHLAHVAGRDDVWYVPIGPLYAHHTLCEHTQVRALKNIAASARFAVFNRLDSRVYNGSVTLKFRTAMRPEILVNGEALAERTSASVDRWDGRYFRRDGDHLLITTPPNTVVEFRMPESSGSLHEK